MKRFHKLNGYVLRYLPNHPRAFTKGLQGKNGHVGYVYEHILVAERNLGRPLKFDEEVHHMDFQRSNNRPNNVLVMLRSQHAKLHRFLSKIGYNEPQLSHRQFTYCKIPRCLICKFPIDAKKKLTCSEVCHKIRKQREQIEIDAQRPDRKQLHRMLLKGSWSSVSREIGLSDNGLRKYAKRIGLDITRY